MQAGHFQLTSVIRGPTGGGKSRRKLSMVVIDGFRGTVVARLLLLILIC